MEKYSNPLRGKRSSLLWRDGGPMNFPTHCQTKYQTKMSEWATEYISNPPSEFCIQFVKTKMKTKMKMKSEYKIFLKPNTKKYKKNSTNFHENLSLSPKGERTAPPGRVDQNLTDILSDVSFWVQLLLFIFGGGVGIREYFSNPS